MWLRQLATLLTKAAGDFRRNHGFLLAGAVAYYTLLSVVPLSILALSVLSHFLNSDELIHTISIYLNLIAPGLAATLTDQVRLFVENRQVIGVIGFVCLLFFSSIAFSVLESAISVVYFHRIKRPHRTFLVSALIPYMYILALAFGIVVVSVVIGTVETFESGRFSFFGHAMSFAFLDRMLVYVAGITGELLILTSLYVFMPVGRITLRHAVTGGVFATVLWECARRLLVWYYASLSMVNIIYGSIASVVVALLGIEVAAIIVLFGAQIIAELEHQKSHDRQG